ncbi:carboxypeptidase-like regulatory domain-containing protein [Fibrobacter sp.]|uniref:carboxypeptidase-like regulatory domain-containing protein n=1 Tax=Fibrobacter sp. TaxID=35828 RepID=UPI00388FAB18
MKRWVCHKGLVAIGALGALVTACTGGIDPQSSSTFETENSVALFVPQSDGSPAARSKVLVRPADFLAGKASVDEVTFDSVAGIFNGETDHDGRLNVPKMKSGKYVVEVRNEKSKGSGRFTVLPDACDSLTVDMAKSGSLSGQVLMPTGVSSVKVGIRGLDYVVQTDSLGNFEFESLPAGSFNAVGFIYSTSDYINEDGDLDTYESFQALGVASVDVKSDETKEGVVIGSRKGPSAADTLPYVMLSDFEDSTYGWYTSFSRFSKMKLSAVAGGGKYGLVAHMDCHSDSLYTWTMMGHKFGKFHDFSSLDSVRFWARGENPDNDSMWVSVSFDVHVDNSSADSLLGYESGKAWAHKAITNEWTKVVITPKDLVPPDSNKTGGNLGWEKVKDHVNSFGIFSARINTGDYEVWVDDIEIFGVKGLNE